MNQPPVILPRRSAAGSDDGTAPPRVHPPTPPQRGRPTPGRGGKMSKTKEAATLRGGMGREVSAEMPTRLCASSPTRRTSSKARSATTVRHRRRRGGDRILRTRPEETPGTGRPLARRLPDPSQRPRPGRPARPPAARRRHGPNAPASKSGSRRPSEGFGAPRSAARIVRWRRASVSGARCSSSQRCSSGPP